MGQREDVRASLLASRGVDEVARRKVADTVKTIVHEATQLAVVKAEIGESREADALAADAGTAASAVVLASDLRAPEAITVELDAIESEMRDIGIPMISTDAPKTAETIANGQYAYPTNQDPPDDTMAELAAAHEIAKAFVWVAKRESLVKVERLLAEFKAANDEGFGYGAHGLNEALSIVRSLLGGE